MRFWIFILVLALANVCQALDLEGIKPSVVRLIVFGEGDSGGTGTGFVVGANAGGALVATNSHVVSQRAQDDSIIVARKNGDAVESYAGVVQWEDPLKDLAIVRVENLNAPTLTIHRVGPKQGEEVFALGFPGVADDDASISAFAEAHANKTSHRINDPTGQASRFVEATLSKASVRRVVKGTWEPGDPIPEFNIIEHDVNITAGNSGGPLLNQCGLVVGVNTQRVPDPDIPIDIVRKSSHSSELISALDNLGIRYKSTSEPCVAAALAGKSVSGFWIPVFAILSAAGVGVALFLALKKPAFVRETYTQFLRRSPPPPNSPAPPPILPAAIPQQPPPAGLGGWVLQGENPEAGGDRRVRIEVPTSMIGRGKLIVGRKAGVVHFPIRNTSISSQHATLLLDETGLYIEDRNSSNGTRINGKKLAPFSSVKLRAGDSVVLGEMRFQVSAT
jgi:phosphohistidine swiveling domain-containing protein